MVEARRSRKRATWPIPLSAERVERRRGCKPARYKGKHTSGGLEGSERGCSDVRMTQCCNLLSPSVPSPSSSRILLALRLTLTLAEHRSVSSNEVSGERLARGSPEACRFKPGWSLIGGHRSDLPPLRPVKTGTGSIRPLVEPRQRRRNRPIDKSR